MLVFQSKNSFIFAVEKNKYNIAEYQSFSFKQIKRAFLMNIGRTFENLKFR
jgi:hypothetical protein